MMKEGKKKNSTWDWKDTDTNEDIPFWKRICNCVCLLGLTLSALYLAYATWYLDTIDHFHEMGNKMDFYLVRGIFFGGIVFIGSMFLLIVLVRELVAQIQDECANMV